MRLNDIFTLSAGATPATPGFLPVQGNRLKPGFTRSAWWLRVSVGNGGSTALPLVLVFQDTRLQKVDFYTGCNGHWTHDGIDPGPPRVPVLFVPLSVGELHARSR
ncbi:7TMR-DISMED2 domain-containing protein [Paraburkholderia bryophila]|uniref:7TMR-DISMED2 domain-containing protein n=1 Tax=Paraburkholderia bryophila TaxID=420952 RepID=UPI00211BCE9A|nr:7TM-DISM domain-containing protein [Paraburkholderia bryophila]